MSSKNNCHKLDVPISACRLRFGTTTTTSGEHIGDTLRDEMVIAHYDTAGRIVELELVGNGKPCQEPDDGVEGTSKESGAAQC